MNYTGHQEKSYSAFENWLSTLSDDEISQYWMALTGWDDDWQSASRWLFAEFKEDLFDKWLDNEGHPPKVEDCRL